MKHVSRFTTTLLLILLLSACGAQATPTVDPVAQALSVQSTIVAAASTNVAGTQAAIPTATIPPTATITNTPDATATLPVMPTIGATFTAIAGGTAGPQDPCINTVMPAVLEGEKIKMRIDNPTKATIMVSVNLHQVRVQDQCGYRSYSLEPQGSLVISDLVVGCYSIWAWNPDPDDYFMVTNGTSCLNTSNSWTFDISKNGISLR